MTQLLRTIGLIFVASCSWLPADSPPQKPAAVDADLAALVHTWLIENHALTGNTNLSDADAARLHGRKVEITATGFKTPWQGSCDDISRDKHDRGAAEISMKLDLTGEAWATVSRFGIGPRATEYALSCADRGHRTPPLTIYVTGDRALTCFGGACYLLTR
ncbi:MAG: hypothetical protein JWO36_1146 [Myxococcales bacterium]|nr:hypothetical protein [Myxococcales bacterium]